MGGPRRRHDGSWGYVRGGGVLRELPGQRGEAHPGLRDLRRSRRPPLPGEEGEEQSPDPPRRERRGLSQPHQAGLDRQYRRVLLQAEDRPRPAGASRQGADRLVGLPRRGDPSVHPRRQGAGGGRTGPFVPRHHGRGQFFSGDHVEHASRAGPGQQGPGAHLPGYGHPPHRDERRALSGRGGLRLA